MVQRNVMPSWGAEALLPVGVPCSIWPARPGAAALSRGLRSGQRMAIAQVRSGVSADDHSALMAAAQAGDAGAYARLLRECAPLIKGIARRCGVAPDSADDVVQDVLLTIHRARATYEPARPFDAWLRVIAKRRAIDHLRRAKRQGTREVHAPLAAESHVDEAADPSRGVEQEADAGRIGDAIAALPDRQREAVRFLVVEERSLSEIAATTGRSKGSLKVNLHRALKALRASFARER